MKLLTIIGAMVMDDVFREAVLEDPVGTALDYGFQLTNHEAEHLTAMIAAVDAETFTERAKKLREPICPHEICPYGFAMSKRRQVYAIKKAA